MHTPAYNLILKYSSIFYYQIQNSVSSQMQETLQQPNKVKLHFLIKKKVNFGSALYVVGDVGALGAWVINNALRLNWNTQDYWSGFAQLQLTNRIKIQFKYVVADYNQPTQQRAWWEDGEFNRYLTLSGDQQNVIVDNLWSANKICLNLLVPKFAVINDTEIYLAGGCNELGNWRNRLKMDKISMENLNGTQIIKAKENIMIEDYQVYSVLLSVERNLKNFSYYFIKKTASETLIDRIPQREFKIQLGQNQHPTCLHVSCKAGNYELLQLSKFTQIYYSKITDEIYIGGCIETCDDVKELKKRGIGAIVYLSSSSLKCKSGPKNLVKMISEQHNIQYHTRKIDLERTETLIQQARESIQTIAQLAQTEEKIVYVCCSTGTLLSPLLVALYLHIFTNFSIKRALQYVKEKHPLSSIDQHIITLATQIAEQRYFNRENFQIYQNSRISVNDQ